MYSLLFRSKWMAALWVTMILVGVYLRTPSEDESSLIGEAGEAAVVGAFAESVAASSPQARRERERREALEEFNSSANERVGDDDGW